MNFYKKTAVLLLAVMLNSSLVSCGFADTYMNYVRKKDSAQTEETTIMTETVIEETETTTAENISNTDEEDNSNFVIRENVLISYNGVDSHVVIPDNVKKIGDHAFWSLNFIEAVEIPESVTEIEEGAFWSCSGLKFVSAAEGLKTIGEAVFWTCSSLKDVNLPDTVTNIGIGAFPNSDTFTIHTPQGSYAEEYAAANRISSDNTYAVYEARGNEKVIFASQYAYSDFLEFEIADDITEIGACAFQYCERLERIDIPSSVETIGGDAFEYCDSLRFVNISEGCTEIGDGAFEYCRVLTEVNIPSSVEKIAKSSFDHCNDALVIHTPQGSYAENYAIANNIPYDNDINSD